MTQTIFEAIGGSYMEMDGFRIPCLLSLSDGQQIIGVWGQRHLRYLQKHHRATYISLKTTGKLNSYLAGIDQKTEEMFVRLVQQMAECEGVTEKLKEAAPMEWVRRMNNIRNRVMEIISNSLICN